MANSASVGVFQVIDIGKISAMFFEIQAIAHEKLIVDGASDVLDGHFHYALGGLVEQGDNLH